MSERTVAFVAALIGALLAGPSPASADCAAHSVSFTPKAGATKVPRNPEILIAAYGNQRQEVVALLAGSALVAKGGARVPLKVAPLLRQSKGAYQMGYLVLRPTKALAAKTAYRLALAPDQAAPAALRYWVGKLRRYRFTTGAAADRRAPERPKLSTSGYRHARMGCGPSIQIGLAVKGLADDKTPARRLGYLLHVVERRGSGSARKLTIRLGASYAPGATRLGHGMCSGNFRLVDGARYTIRVSAVDWAGNRSKPSNPVTVHALKSGRTP